VATSTYMANRKKWDRPQALLFSDNPGTLDGDFYVPTGNEWENFIIVSDHNRQAISMSKQRIETRQRMVNGTMRSYHIADKLNLSTSWEMLPSRSFSEDPEFDVSGNITNPNTELYTADGGAGGAKLLEWYQNNSGPFWVFLSYDKFGENNMNRYTQVLHMFFAAFDYEIEKRGHAWGRRTNDDTSIDGYDMWNISLSLEEV
jgi:hypothetical protein